MLQVKFAEKGSAAEHDDLHCRWLLAGTRDGIPMKRVQNDAFGVLLATPIACRIPVALDATP
jgi:hypothetical protein